MDQLHEFFVDAENWREGEAGQNKRPTLSAGASLKWGKTAISNLMMGLFAFQVVARRFELPTKGL